MSKGVSDPGFHSCQDRPLMLSSRVFNSDWLSFYFRYCCCFDVRCGHHPPFLSPLHPTFPHAIYSQSFYVLNCIILNRWSLWGRYQWPWFASMIFWSFFLLLGPPGRRKSTDWLSVGQLRRHIGTDHRRLSEGPAQSTNWGGSHFQRYGLNIACFIFIFDSLSVCRPLTWTGLISLSLQAGRGYFGLWQMESMLWSLQKIGTLQYVKPVMTSPT